MNFRILAKEHRRSVGEDLIEKGNIVLTALSYNVRRDPNDNHVEDDVFGPNIMKYMARVLGDMAKSRVYEHVFCSTLNFALCYKSFASKQTKGEPVPVKVIARAYLRERIGIV